jgi:hypothetical protein
MGVALVTILTAYISALTLSNQAFAQATNPDQRTNQGYQSRSIMSERIWKVWRYDYICSIFTMIKQFDLTAFT